MASTFAELFSDFQDIARLYTEKLNVTELNFMRLYTRGIQNFQRRTEYVEKIMRVNKQLTPPYFTLPLDALRVIEIREPDNKKVLLQDFTQWYNGVDNIPTGRNRVPTHHDYLNINKDTPLITVFDRELAGFPDIDVDYIIVHYIPDLPAITAPVDPNNPTVFDVWASWFPFDGVNFDTMFRTARTSPSLAPFENGFLEYALAQFVRSQGSANYKVFEQTYEQAVSEAILYKPTYWKSGLRDYYMAPWS